MSTKLYCFGPKRIVTGLLLSVAMATAFIAANLPNSAFAQAFDADDLVAVQSLGTRFETAFSSGEIRIILDESPPAIWEDAAERTGGNVADIRAAALNALQHSDLTQGVQEFEITMDNLSPQTTPTGRNYIFVPTRMVVSQTGAGVFEARNHTLFLEDNDRWYFMPIREARHIAALTQSYQDFADVEFDLGAIRRVD
jgi:hypothetical protein